MKVSKGAERDGIVTLLDVGTTKVAALIVALDRDHEVASGGEAAFPGQVIGFGYQRARGLKAGMVVDLEEAEQSIRATVAQAERMAGINVREVVVSVGCGRLKSRNAKARAALESHAVRAGDVERIMASAKSHAENDGRCLVHLNRIGWRLDGVGGFEDVIGMKGDELAADLHAVTADESPLRNLVHAVERAYLDVSGMVASPFASAIAATSADERRLGITAIEMGGGTTSLSLFAEGHFIHTDAIAIGGSHITFDIARALCTPLAEAERIKTLYGGIFGAASDEHEVISYPTAGEEDRLQHVTKAELRRIIRPRVEQLVNLLRERLETTPLAQFAGERVVLTGGASQLIGQCELVANILARPARIGRPYPLAGLPASVCNPSFATVVGLASTLTMPDAGVRAFKDRDVLGGSVGYLGRVGQWVRESF